MGHFSDCATHNEPAYPNGPCDCGQRLAAFWMPIETAPKDGSPVLGFDPRGVDAGNHYYWPENYKHNIIVMRWKVKDSQSHDTAFWATTMSGYYGGSSIYGDPPDWEGHRADPTHWMPLPEPPQH